MSKKETIFGISISLVSLIIIGLTFISYNLSKLINLRYFTNSDEYIFHTDKLGHFGDFIGGFLGTILTGIATYFVYKTYISQKEELEKQKEELILNRQLIAQQQFESTFFNMLNVHRELKASLRIIENPFIKDSKIGVEVFDSLKNYCKMIFLDDFSNFVNNTSFNTIKEKIIVLENLFTEKYPNDFAHESNSFFTRYNINRLSQIEKNEILNLEKERIDFTFNIVFVKYQKIISHYCRNIYHILKYIRENEENKTLGDSQNKYKNYANIFQSQLNVDEQFLLFYNFIHFNDESKGIYSTINLVNHYQFLENLGHENLLDNEKHNNKNFYNFDIK
jgi:hypothetical protein